MRSRWRHSIWNANAESRESHGGNSFATRKYLRSLVYLPSTTSSDIVASPSLVTSPDCRTAPQHIKPYSLTSTFLSVVFHIPPGVVGLLAHVADVFTKSETTPANLPTSGNRPLDAVIMDERRDGPRWLCDDDDENAPYSRILHIQTQNCPGSDNPGTPQAPRWLDPNTNFHLARQPSYCSCFTKRPRWQWHPNSVRTNGATTLPRANFCGYVGYVTRFSCILTSLLRA